MPIQCYFFNQFRQVACKRASGGTFMKALSVALSTSPTAVIRFSAFSVTKLMDSLFAPGSVKSRKHKQGREGT